MAKLEIKTSQQKIPSELSTLLFGISPEQKQAADLQKQVQDITLSQLHPFRDHPFKVLDDKDMADMVESVTQFGVLVPAIARPDPNGGYELIAGHRRHHACQMAGLQTMPVLVREMDDDEATIIMVDSNLQRETLLPSERAFAYKMKLDAMKRQAGRPVQNNCSQVGNNFGKRSSEVLAEQLGQSKNQIFRFIRLTELVRPLLDLVDEKKLPINPAYELSFLKPNEQQLLLEEMERTNTAPSLAQAQKLKQYSQEGKLSSAVIEVILSEEKKPSREQVLLDSRTLHRYFPKSYTTKQMQETILQLLEKWQQEQ